MAIDDVASAGFTEVTGLPAEGGTAGEAGLRLTQGLTSGPGLAGWFAAARQGDAVPRSGSVVLRDEAGRPASAWRLHQMHPCALQAAGGRAGGDVVVDAMELTARH